jgi:LysM repeat protein
MSYIVKSGDTLSAIAERNHTTVAKILAANPQIKNANAIYPGQSIKIPGAAPAPAPAPKPAPAPAPSPSSYTVKPGDTLSDIASEHGVSVQDLLKANPQIKNPNAISVGQKINIPKGGHPSGGGGTPSNGGGGGGGHPVPSSGPWQLPSSGAARPLAHSDFQAAARELGCEAAAVHAVAEVESGGRTGFDSHKRPKILFEPSLFRSATGGRYDASHPQISCPYNSPRRRQSYARDQWVVIHEAFALDPDAAVKCASWGMFQVLGSNYKSCGWSSVRQFVMDMFESEAQHMRAFLGYCKANNLVRHLKSHNWASFARGYNGPDYASNHYDTKMASAYARYRNQG